MSTLRVASSARRLGHRTILAVPLIRAGQAIGAIYICRTEVRPFTDRQIGLLKTFADQAVIAIENTRLFEAEQARTRELTEALEQQTATSEILSVISSSPSDLQPVLDAVARSSAQVCGAQDATVHLREADRLRLAAHHGPVPVIDAGLDMPLSRGLVGGRAVLDREPVHVYDVSQAEDFPEGREFARRIGFKTILAVPLLREDVGIGVVTIRRVERDPFSDKQVALLKTFAEQAMIAIENTRLFEEVQARTRELTESLERQTATSEVLSVISGSPGKLEPVFEAMLSNAVRISDAKFGTLWLAEGNQFRSVALHGLAPALVEARQRLPVVEFGPDTPIGRAIGAKRVVHIDDMAKDPAYVERNPRVVGLVEWGGARTVLYTPMLKETELIGVISIYRQEVRPFTEKQIELVSNFAKQAVIAIENTRLLNELRELARTANGNQRGVGRYQPVEV